MDSPNGLKLIHGRILQDAQETRLKRDTRLSSVLFRLEVLMVPLLNWVVKQFPRQVLGDTNRVPPNTFAGENRAVVAARAALAAEACALEIGS